MKKLTLSSLLVLLTPALAGALATKPIPPNPADYAVLVHVVFSRAQLDSGGSGQQALQTIIDGRNVEMVCASGGVLVPGDYKAKLSVNAPSNSYNLYESYELLLPDRTLRDCNVTGLGPDPKSSPS